MFDDENLGPEVLQNPGIVQRLALTEIQNRIDGTFSIADPNNSFCLMMEYGSSNVAQMVRQETDKFDALYPQRATTAEQLYAFVSDYDYLNLTAAPSTLNLQVLLDQDWIIANAVPYDTTYNKLVIPATAVFTLGIRSFGIYYPIQFLVNRATNVVTVTYDVSVPNPLQTVSSNLLTDVTVSNLAGINYMSLIFPVYQFSVNTITEQVTAQTGFLKSYTYTDQFYAARVYSISSAGTTELQYSLSQMVYDPETPTVLITLLEDNQTIQLEIPQIYFTNNQIGTTIQINLYTSQGLLNVTIPQTDASTMSLQINPGTNQYAAAFSSPPPTCIVTPYQQTLLTGGANPMPFQAFRNAVVTGSLYSETPINPMQLQAVTAKYGFTLTKYNDNITQRIFFAGASMSTPDGRLVPVAVSGITLQGSSLAGDPSTILQYPDGLYTILPTTLFSYSQTNNISTPLTDEQVSGLAALTPTALANALNTNTYTRQPFHIVLDTSPKYPVSRSYNLMSPTMSSLIFVGENRESPAQLQVISAVVTHQNAGTGGYLIQLGVTRSAPLQNVDPSQLAIVLLATSYSGTILNVAATYNTTKNNVDVWTAFIPTNYHISAEGNFETTLNVGTATGQINELPLITNFDVRLCVEQSLYPSISNDPTLTVNLPTPFASYLVMCQQTMQITFGEDLTGLIFNPVNITWGAQTYQTYLENQYYTNAQDVYLSNSSGVPIYQTTTVNNVPTVQLVLLFAKGTPVLTQGNFNLHLTAAVASGATSLPVNSTAGILLGSTVSAPGVPASATVTAITGNTLTISMGTTTALTLGAAITIPNATVNTTTTAAQSAAGNTLTLATVAGVQVGMTVFGLNIPANTTVTAINNMTVTLSTATTAVVANNAVICILNMGGPQSLQYAQGATQLDAYGNPIVSGARSNIYQITAIQFDAKLYASQNPNDVAYAASLAQTVVTNGHILDPVRNTLLEQTDMYYVPYRTIGMANYGVGNGVTQSMSLALSFNVNYYVSEAIKANTQLLDVIEAKTITTISQYLSTNLISSNAIGKLLESTFGSTIDSVDVSGLNQTSVMTAAVGDPGVQPSLAYLLEVGADGTLSMEPNVTVTFYTTPTPLTIA